MRRITNIRFPRRPNGTGAESPEHWSALVDDAGRLQALTPMGAGASMAGENWQGDWLSPMGVDLQINGGLGLAFPELQERDLPRLLELLDLLWQDGVEAISPTLVTCGVAPLRQALAVLRAARAHDQPRRCRLLGAHLEARFSLTLAAELTPGSTCASPAWRLSAPASAASSTTSPWSPWRRSWRALERSSTPEGVGHHRGLGHSAATADQASQAFEAGVGMLTHAFNAMPGLHHRAPGPLAEACRSGKVALGLIADGVHVHPTMAVLLQELAGDQLVLVSDALAPYGLADGEHRWDERVLLVKNGTCRLDDGTLAGVTLPRLEGQPAGRLGQRPGIDLGRHRPRGGDHSRNQA